MKEDVPVNQYNAEREYESETKRARGKAVGEGCEKEGLEQPVEEVKDDVQADLFARFWQAYPRKVSRRAAEKAWRELAPDAALVEHMIEVVWRAGHSEQWQKEKGKYVPYPATWLAQRRWEDELPPVKADIMADGGLMV